MKSFWYNTIDSTMDEAKRLIRTGQVNDIAYVVAYHQTRGRGTRRREWASPPHAGIYLSVIHLHESERKLISQC
jgi:BirA family biotin operon repressor/biotin-[acetyl-CoA-carboxylase] ligase